MNRPSSSKAPLHPWEYAFRPWSRIHINLAGPLMGKMFLVIIDAPTKWIDVEIVNFTSVVSTIIKLCSLFATHGISEQLVSDNNQVFEARNLSNLQLRMVLKTYSHHLTSSPTTDLVKVMYVLSRFLLQYRVTPQTTTGLSPSKLLMERKIRTCHAVHPDKSEDVEKKQEGRNLESLNWTKNESVQLSFTLVIIRLRHFQL